MLTAAAFFVSAVIPSGPSSFIPCVQAWTFNSYSTEEAIQRVAESGSKAIELFPGQTLSAGTGDVKVGPDMGDDNTAKLEELLTASGLRAVAYGVTGISKDMEEARKLFRWAKGLGILVINTESADAIDTIEAMVKEFDIKVGFHDHPKRPDDPSYRMWDPSYVYSLVEGRDPRIGANADTGHWVRSGLKPVDAIRTLRGRIVSSHLKDLNQPGPDGHDVPYGTGVSDVPGILEEFRKIGMSGPVSVEYEYNWTSSLPEVAQCIGFLRAFQVLQDKR